MAPLVLLAVPLLLRGLILGTLVVVALLVALLLYLGISELHELSQRDAAVTVAATFAVWILVSLYIASNLA